MKNKEKPLVTIVTITFNLIKSGREKYFRQCLESVHNQTYSNIEHLIIDGYSQDDSLNVIKEYEKKGWVRYISEADKGIYDAMNKGIKLARGKYITFLNSDDFYQNKEAVKLSVEALEKAGADYSYADTQGINEEKDELIDIWKGDVNRIPFGNHYCHQSMFVKTDVLRETGNFDTSFRISADSDLMVRLVALGKKSIYVPHCIVSYRSGGLSNEYIKETRKEHSGIFYKYLGKKNGLTREECSELWNFSVLNEKNIFYCLWLGGKIKNKEWQKEYYKRLFSFQNFKNQVKYALPWPVRKPIVKVYKMIRGKK
jgi:glycosyltransferase involved in cell wall biosynthesis